MISSHGTEFGFEKFHLLMSGTAHVTLIFFRDIEQKLAKYVLVAIFMSNSNSVLLGSKILKELFYWRDISMYYWIVFSFGYSKLQNIR